MIVVIVLEIVDVSIFKKIRKKCTYSELTILRNFTPTFTGNGTQLTIYIKAII